MKKFATLLEASPEYRPLLSAAEKTAAGIHFAAGLTNVHKAHYIYSLCVRSGKRAHVVAPNEQTAARLCEDLNALYGYPAAELFPARELFFREVEGASHEFEHARLRVLGRIVSGDCLIAVSSIEGAAQFTMPHGQFTARTVTLEAGAEQQLDALLVRLVAAGYSRCDQVEGPAQFSVRGGILDLFPPDAAQPFRVEFWGDEIDTIATFDPVSQRRTASLEAATLTPAREAVIADPAAFSEQLAGIAKTLRGKYGALAKENIARDLELMAESTLQSADKYLPLLYDSPETLFDYCGDRLLFACEPASMKETLRNLSFQQHEDIRELMAQGVLFKGCDSFSADFVDVMRIMQQSCTFILDTFTRSLPELRIQSLQNVQAIQLSVWSGDYSFLKEDLTAYMDRGFCVAVFAGTARGCEALCNDLVRDGLPAETAQDIAAIAPGKIYILECTLSAGMEYPDLKLAMLTHSKTTAPAKKKKARHKAGKKLRALSDLNVGDYVVHSGHGIGVFEGIVKRDMHGIVKDYIRIRYAGTDTLFVPVTQLDLVSKYIGAAENASVKLNRLNSAEWQKTRQRVKAAVQDMARELIALYAKRLHAKGFTFSPDSEWQREFEERFPYDETDDQLRCVEEIKQDMQRPMPMDRLLCGDVGFGKTEVALRAVFKCVLDGKQCAVLVPTTILAWQHFKTFTQRLAGYPMTVELLSRFRTPKEQQETIRKLRRGEVDIVIGTHRVVQKDIQFKDLGLCIIDEEQRFGVGHKEKFKEMRENIDVLTLSATPIPRTLNMAMSGIRDMSLIEEAPQDRHPVQTYVMEHDWGVIAQAITKEIRRGGQVFYLHNRIDSIAGCASRLMELVPEARIVVAHGRVGEEELSNVWRQLVEHEVDILVCTTIIETGVDVPNCNTLIIEDADRMGLSQLYQLRGRVGRSSRRAYAYLTFRRDKAISDVATKRLSAIREFTTFGSGFQIAMRDLEIRGAGNVLGAQQHGHMEAVGYDLYLKLLGEAVSEEQGKPARSTTECVIDIRIHAHIPESYIENLTQRIDVYKKIASVTTQEDALDVTDELIDRFGDPPTAVKGLIDVALVRNSASALGIKEIQQNDDRIILYPENFDMGVAGKIASGLKGRALVNAGMKPYFSVSVPTGTDPVDTIREVLEAIG